VAIKASTARDVDALLTQLRDGTPLQRESAIARLRIIGGRAIDRLITLASSANDPPDARAAALRALEGTDNMHARAAGLACLADGDEGVAVAAVGVLRGWVTRDDSIEVLDALTALALDQERGASVRLAALDAISDLPKPLVQPLLHHIGVESAQGTLLDDPVTARDWVAGQGQAPLSTLHDFIVLARERERAEVSAQRRQEWLTSRGAAHALLASRGSRVALYDLRETFDAAEGVLPLDFLTAITAIGDINCLEPMARAWAAVPAQESWWRDRLADAATDILNRLRLSGRSGLVKRLRAKYAGFI
jgi:hypothetical protein